MTHPQHNGGEWRTIESAPKDGIRIKVSDGVFITEAWFEPNLNDFVCMDSEWNLILLGTVTMLKKWMPLPSPPEAYDR